jgi:chaperonin cofactor prefoldin
MRERTLDLQSDNDGEKEPEPPEDIELKQGDDTPAHLEDSEEYQMMQQSIEAIRQQLEGMEYTIDRLEDASDDELVMQQLEGGVLVEVPPQDRDRVLENVRSAQNQLSSRLDEHEDKVTEIRGGAE